MALSVKLRGVSHVVNNLKEFEEKIIKASKKAIIETALVDIETGAKKKITQDQHIDTGRLRASIHTSYKGHETHSYQDTTGASYVSKLDLDVTGFQVVVGTDVSYAMKIEDLDSYLYYAFKRGKKKLQVRMKKNLNKILKGG